MSVFGDVFGDVFGNVFGSISEGFIITNFVNGGTAQLEMLTSRVPASVVVGGVTQGALVDQGNGIYTFPVVRSNGTDTTLRDGENYPVTVDLT